MRALSVCLSVCCRTLPGMAEHYGEMPPIRADVRISIWHRVQWDCRSISTHFHPPAAALACFYEPFISRLNLPMSAHSMAAALGKSFHFYRGIQATYLQYFLANLFISSVNPSVHDDARLGPQTVAIHLSSLDISWISEWFYPPPGCIDYITYLLLV